MPSPENDEYDVIVVGAGIVGPPTAVQLAKQGKRVLLLERDFKEPDRIVGELLQPGGIEALRKMGLEDTLEGIDGITCVGYQVTYNGQPVDLDYPGKATGLSFHHGKFITKLREVALSTAGITAVQATVTDLVRNPHNGHVLGVQTKKDGQSVNFFAPLTIMSDGITSNFRKTVAKRQTQVLSHMAGLILEDAVLPAPNHGHVIIGTTHAPILVYQIGQHETRILCDIQGPLPSNGNGDLRRYIEDKVVQNLPETLRPSLIKALAEQKIRTMPAQYLPASTDKLPGLVLLGDALNMRHPLTGGGMTVAFNDVLCLTEALSLVQDFKDVAAVEEAYNQFLKNRKKYSSCINILAVALYRLFGASSFSLQMLQRGCFGYFERGGTCVSEPMGLLGGIYQDPGLLFRHFFSVAFYAIWLNMKAQGLNIFLSLIQAVMALYTAVIVFMPLLWTETTV